MRKRIIFLVAVSLASCQGYVNFTSPQPHGKKDLTTVPDRFHGSFGFIKNPDETEKSTLSDLSYIYHITAENILRVIEFEGVIPDSSMDSLFPGGPVEEPGFIVRPHGEDSLYIKYWTTDSLLNGPKEIKMRYWKKGLYLSFRESEQDEEPGKWDVHLFRIDGDTLTVSTTAMEDVAAIELLGGFKGPPGERLVSLDRRKLKKFVREGGFRNREKFLKK